MSVDQPEKGTIAPLYVMEPWDHPLRRPVTLSFHAGDLPWPEDAIIAYRETRRGGDWNYLSHVRAMNGFVMTGRAYSFETFTVIRDSVPPEVGRFSLRDGARLRNRTPRLSADIEDRLAGLDLDRCALYLNGEEVIWEYDPDRDSIFYRPQARLHRGRHSWTVLATDRVGNVTQVTRRFTVR
jgi:hypothetical protein